MQTETISQTAMIITDKLIPVSTGQCPARVRENKRAREAMMFALTELMPANDVAAFIDKVNAYDPRKR